MDKLTQVLRESPAPMPPDVAIPAIQSHLHIVLGLCKGLEEPKLTAKVHELMADAAALQVDKPASAAA